MSSVLFLLLAFALSALGTAVLVWRNRQPNRIETGIHEFQKEMHALSPESRRVVMPGQAPPSRRPFSRGPYQATRDDSGE
jgi:hypothetical protein